MISPFAWKVVDLSKILRALYGIRMSHIFEIPSISNKKPSISIEIPSVSIENLSFRMKYQVFRFRNFQILGFPHPEFEILDISSEILSISKTWNFDLIARTEEIIFFIWNTRYFENMWQSYSTQTVSATSLKHFTGSFVLTENNNTHYKFDAHDIAFKT